MEDTFNTILNEMRNLHEKKNADYGNAWYEEIKRYGAFPAVVRLYEKHKRLESLYNAGRAQCSDESFEDTLLDIANYAVMTLAALRDLDEQVVTTYGS